MTHPCEEECTRGGHAGQPPQDSFTGDDSHVSIVQPFSIYNTIIRTTAGHLIE